MPFSGEENTRINNFDTLDSSSMSKQKKPQITDKSSEGRASKKVKQRNGSNVSKESAQMDQLPSITLQMAPLGEEGPPAAFGLIHKYLEALDRASVLPRAAAQAGPPGSFGPAVALRRADSTSLATKATPSPKAALAAGPEQFVASTNLSQGPASDGDTRAGEAEGEGGEPKEKEERSVTSLAREAAARYFRERLLLDRRRSRRSPRPAPGHAAGKTRAAAARSAWRSCARWRQVVPWLPQVQFPLQLSAPGLWDAASISKCRASLVVFEGQKVLPSVPAYVPHRLHHVPNGSRLRSAPALPHAPALRRLLRRYAPVPAARALPVLPARLPDELHNEDEQVGGGAGEAGGEAPAARPPPAQQDQGRGRPSAPAVGGAVRAAAALAAPAPGDAAPPDGARLRRRHRATHRRRRAGRRQRQAAPRRRPLRRRRRPRRRLRRRRPRHQSAAPQERIGG